MLAPTYINTSQPSRTAPIHSTVASFGKNSIEYRKVANTPSSSKPTLVNSVWPSLNKAKGICDVLAVPKSAKNLRPLEAPRVQAPIFPAGDPFVSYCKAQMKVKKMIDISVASTPSSSKVRLVQRILTPPVYPDPDLELFDNYKESGFDWAGEPMVQHDISQEPPVSLGEESEDPYHFDELDESDNGCPC